MTENLASVVGTLAPKAVANSLYWAHIDFMWGVGLVVATAVTVVIAGLWWMQTDDYDRPFVIGVGSVVVVILAIAAVSCFVNANWRVTNAEISALQDVLGSLGGR